MGLGVEEDRMESANRYDIFMNNDTERTGTAM